MSVLSSKTEAFNLLSLKDLSATLSQDNFLLALLETFESMGVEPVLVGGLLRDYLLKGQIGHDFDFIVPEETLLPLCEALKETHAGKIIPLDTENGVYRLVFPSKSLYLDLARCQGESIAIDLMRRDLSINAIALNLKTGEVLDPTGGQDDLRNRVVRAFRLENLLDDPLRLLRVLRFHSALFPCTIDAETLGVLHMHADRIKLPAVERSQHELALILSAQHGHETLVLCYETGLLAALLPEVEATLPEALAAIRRLAGFEFELPQSLLDKLNQPLNDMNSALTLRGVCRLLCLLQSLSGLKIKTLSARLKWSQQLTQWVTAVLASVQAEKPNNDDIYDVLGEKMRLKILLEALIRGWPLENIAAEWQAYCAFEKREASLPQLLNGQDIQQLLKTPPSPFIGQCLHLLRQAQRAGQVVTIDDARQFVMTLHRHESAHLDC